MPEPASSAADLLLLETQPSSQRACNALLALWVTAFSSPIIATATLFSPSARRRLGYLITAARLIGGAPVHPTWRDYALAQESLVSALPREPFLACDPAPNPADDLARIWGLTRGVDTAILTQLVEQGNC